MKKVESLINSSYIKHPLGNISHTYNGLISSQTKTDNTMREIKRLEKKYSKHFECWDTEGEKQLIRFASMTLVLITITKSDNRARLRSEDENISIAGIIVQLKFS